MIRGRKFYFPPYPQLIHQGTILYSHTYNFEELQYKGVGERCRDRSEFKNRREQNERSKRHFLKWNHQSRPRTIGAGLLTTRQGARMT
jgi:hypothetical protein